MRREKYRYIVHLLRSFDAPLLIGRSTDTDVKINDISVSRKHAVIDMFNSNFYLKDCNSKFGTLVMLKKPFVITKQSEVTLQINRTVLRLKILKDFNTLEGPELGLDLLNPPPLFLAILL